MIEMERIQNLNLGQEADEKVEDDQRTRFHIEHQSKLRRGLARAASLRLQLARLFEENARCPRHLSAFRHNMRGSRFKWRWAFYRALTTTDKVEGSTKLVLYLGRLHSLTNIELNNRRAANATYLEINVRLSEHPTNIRQIDRLTSTAEEKM